MPDWRQVLLLLGAIWRMDLRPAPESGAAGAAGSAPARALVRALGLYVLLGAGIGFGLSRTADGRFTYSFGIGAYLMFMLALIVLVEYERLILNPDDAAILGAQPVSGATYFWARVLHVLRASGLLILALIAVPVVLAFHTYGPVAALGDTIAWVLAGITTVLAMIWCYALLALIVDARRLARALIYLQIGLSLALAFGYQLISLSLGGTAARVHLSPTPALLLVPPAWYAGLAQVLAGSTGRLVPGLATVALVAPVVLSVALGRGLSLRYAAYLADLRASVGAGAGVPLALRFWHLPLLRRVLADPVRRAAFALVVAYLARDPVLKRTVLTSLSLAIAWPVAALVLLAHGGAQAPDPAALSVGRLAPDWLILYAGVMSAGGLVPTLAASTDWRASWVLAAGLDAAPQLLQGVRLAAYTLAAPFLLLLALLPFVLLHLGLAATLMQASLLVAAIAGQERSLTLLRGLHLPLSAAPASHGTVSSLARVLLIGAPALAALVEGLTVLAIAVPWLGPLLVLAMAVIVWRIGRLERRRIARDLARWEFVL